MQRFQMNLCLIFKHPLFQPKPINYEEPLQITYPEYIHDKFLSVLSATQPSQE